MSFLERQAASQSLPAAAVPPHAIATARRFVYDTYAASQANGSSCAGGDRQIEASLLKYRHYYLEVQSKTEVDQAAQQDAPGRYAVNALRLCTGLTFASASMLTCK